MREFLDLHAYADGQLAAEDRAALEMALKENPELRRELDSILALKGSLKQHCQAGVENPELFEICKGRIRDLDRLNQANHFVGKYAWGLCGAFVLLIAGGAVLNRNDSQSTLYTSDMARLTQSLSPVQVPSAQADRDQKVLSGIGPAQLVIQDPSVQVLGMATGLVDGRRAARLTLADSGGVFSLLMVENINRVEMSEQSYTDRQFCHGKIEGTSCVTWTAQGFGMILAGERSGEELVNLAKSIRIIR